MTRRAAASRPTRTSRRVRLLVAPADAAAVLAAAGPDAGPSPGASFCVDASQAPSI